ncbi:RAD9, HUS1, RAD1-interacting nuclear orphan protein 1 [Polyodon spathula]|uniref:RAD9, HUS1, RAD1-interacting nuclear orphan protein 1 n=1 Tax=Polyodon spathula TaxID=7913 RepID=UPI001B7EE8D6|nr:RAD9, HUS1, RAD1-interacting nuclear orphan protein 1 [Polyodon spathula]XP_041111187.1 RAD9, HUS1, RAD1-interacting nuclear orphan protein 1 [Polyodon spathula]
MPRKKKNSCNARKVPLLFRECPLDGAKHQYEAPLQSARNPKHVPSVPMDQNTFGLQWVSPQFDTTLELHFPAQRKKRHQSGNSSHHRSLLNRSSVIRAKKTSVCKFPALAFKDTLTPPQSKKRMGIAAPLRKNTDQNGGLLKDMRGLEDLQIETPQIDHPAGHNISDKTDGKNRYPVGGKTPRTSSRFPDFDNVFTPPELRTPDADNHPHHDGVRGSEAWRDVALLLAPTPSDTPPPSDTLVQDTPEQQYGVKVTWRRRMEVMKFLKDRGKLSNREILVNNLQG